MSMIELTIQAILTIAITTLAWKDTPVSKTAEHIYVGVITANLIVNAWRSIVNTGWNNIIAGQIIYILPAGVGPTPWVAVPAI